MGTDLLLVMTAASRSELDTRARGTAKEAEDGTAKPGKELALLYPGEQLWILVHVLCIHVMHKRFVGIFARERP